MLYCCGYLLMAYQELHEWQGNAIYDAVQAKSASQNVDVLAI